jgi:predicted 3-demethylubiquinone-9 3-methyltransferase (glyoxalase superfamily)
MQKITPFLWFDGNAEQAAEFYASIFPGATYEVGMRNPDGSALVVSFKLHGLSFSGLNGGPNYKFSPATSFLIRCDGQAEVDHYWNNLVEGGKPMACGWLDDKFGVTWQIVPKQFFELLSSGTPAQSQAVMGAMMGMIKFDISEMQKAFDVAA